MLYLSTRNKVDSITAYRALHLVDEPDGGQYLPMQLPILTDIQLAALEQMSFGETAAFMMNLFFGTQINGWDVDFAVGRQAVTLTQIGHKVSISEIWHNPAGEYDYLVQRLHALACGDHRPTHRANRWFRTVVDIAVLFSTYGKLCHCGIYEIDVAVETGDLQRLLSIRYAQKMGLSVDRIILGGLEGDGLWELISYGDYQTGRKVLPSGLEGLLWLEFGDAEVESYMAAVAKRGIYKMNPLHLETFRRGMFAAVVGDARVQEVAVSTLRTAGYAMDSHTSRAFGALQDYRAKYGESRNTLLLAEKMPGDPNKTQLRRS